MPLLEKAVIEDITARLHKYLKALGCYGDPIYLAAGGSAAIFKVSYEDGSRVFKVFNPSFFQEAGGDAERRRLEVQRHLIGHKCPSLVQTYRVDEAENTAFMEMEFIPWPQLTEKLALIPDEAVTSLIMQLVDAVRYLEKHDIVHRDIKPENIHISPDFKCLKLLDLGVAREFSMPESEEAAITDHGNNRPFLATAQYSSPEYLFRLDEPSVNLWKGLNFYQVGAVLHDLIMKKPIFQQEMCLGNRWLVARAVLTKTPSFFDANPHRLASLKALAARCLVKDLDTRLQLVGWGDFVLENTQDPLSELKARLAKGSANSGENVKSSTAARLEFDRDNFAVQFTSQVRNELIASCGAKMPFAMTSPVPNTPPVFKFSFPKGSDISIACDLTVKWGDELYCRTATIELSARLVVVGYSGQQTPFKSKVICALTIGEAEEQAIHCTSNEIGALIIHGLDVIDGAGDHSGLNGVDLLQNCECS